MIFGSKVFLWRAFHMHSKTIGGHPGSPPTCSWWQSHFWKLVHVWSKMSCSGDVLASGFTYKWSVFDVNKNRNLPLLKSVSNLPSRFLLPSYTLSSGRNYIVTLTATHLASKSIHNNDHHLIHDWFQVNDWRLATTDRHWWLMIDDWSIDEGWLGQLHFARQNFDKIKARVKHDEWSEQRSSCSSAQTVNAHHSVKQDDAMHNPQWPKRRSKRWNSRWSKR